MTTHSPRDRKDTTNNPRLFRRLLHSLQKSNGHLFASFTLAIGYLAQVGFQMLYFLVLVRMLGPEVFGHFAAASAAIVLVSPLAGLGYGEVALVRVSQRPQDAGLWAANAIVATVVLGTCVSFGLAGSYAFLTSGNWLAWHYVLGLAFSELVIVRSCGVIARVHQASGNVFLTSLNNSLLSATRALIAGTVYLCGVRSLGILITALIIGLMPLAIGFYISLARRWAPMTVSWIRLRQEFRLALSFSAGLASQVIYTDLDKLFLARWTTAVIVGTYTAGYKILVMSFMPLRAILEATVARQYRLGASDPTECIRFTAKLLSANIALASVISVALYLLAPYATLILGSEFESSVGVLRLGFLLPVIQSVHSILANYLTAIGRQSYRTSMQIVTLIVYVVAGFFTIQYYSWTGAIFCSLGCEALLAILLAAGCAYFTERSALAKLWPSPRPLNRGVSN